MATGAAESGGRRFRRKAGAGVRAPDEHAIAAQIGKTGAQVKLVDLASGVLALLAAVLVYLLVLVLLDHWVVRGGLGFWSRVTALLVLLVGVAFYGWRQLAPLALRRINPVYAAAAIEHTQPGVKNSLINFLLLRRQREQLHAAVYEAVEQQAARDLARVPAEGAVDRSQLIRVLYVLLAVLVVGCVYKLFSPKDPLASVGRMLAPWARWQAPTRVWIGEIEPGTTQAFYDDRVRVSAVVQGLRRGEGVTLRYSTADGQVVDQGVPMELPTGSYRHEASLPAGVSGLKQDLEYWIVAGDATTVRHRLQVVTAPAILIERVEYHYPAYTGLPNRTVERQGDLRGLVGTEVTLHAVANREITAAHLDYDCDGRNDFPLKLDGERGTLSIVLGLNADGRPEHESYQLRMTTTDGKSDPQPVRYRIDVAVDQAPELEFVEPAESETELAANGVAALGVRAIDPDFALANITLRAERGGEELLREPLLSAPQAGEFRGGVAFDAAAFGLKPGDEVQYWAEARDQRQPTANHTVTTKRLLKVVSQVTPAERQRQEREAEEQQEKWSEPPPDAGTPGTAGQATPGDAPHDDGQTQSGAPSSRDPGSDTGQGNAADAPRAVPGDAGSDRRGNESKRTQAGRENNPAGDEGERGAEAASAERDPERAAEENSTGQSGAEEDEGTESAGDEAAARDGERGANDSEQGDRGEAASPGARDGAGDERGPQGNEAGSEERNETEGEGNDAARRAAESAARAGERAAHEHGSQREPRGQDPGENQGEQAGQNERIDPESNPGDAFERILQHRQERGGQEPAGSGEREPSSDPRDSAAPPGQPPPGGQAGGQGTEGEASAEEEGQASGGQDATAEAPSDASRAEGESASGRNGQGGSGGSQGAGDQNATAEDTSDANPRNANQPGDNGEQDAGSQSRPKARAENSQPGSGADGQRAEGQRGDDEHGQEGQAEDSDDNASGAENQPAGEGGKPRGGKPTKTGKRRGGEAGHSERQPGAGAPNADDRGNTSPQGAARPRERRAGQGGEQQSNPQGDPASSPSQSDHESNSEGGESGDRSGGGQQGGGQQSSQPGTGGAGSSTEGNEGAAGGSPGGEGETGSQAGNDAQGSGAPEGESTTEGSGQSGAGGADPGSGESGEGSSGGSQGGQPGGAGSGGASQPGSQGGDAQGQRQGGGASGGSPGTESGPGGGSTSPVEPLNASGAPEDDAAAADDPNAQYAREATDLVLEYLEDQLDNDRLDPKLLDELHWSREDIEKFVRRWRAMQRAAAQAGPEGDAARRKLEEALAGLGLRRRGTTISGGEGEESNSLPVEATRRSEPPPEYLEQFKAFTRGTAKARPKKP